MLSAAAKAVADGFRGAARRVAIDELVVRLVHPGLAAGVNVAPAAAAELVARPRTGGLQAVRNRRGTGAAATGRGVRPDVLPTAGPARGADDDVHAAGPGWTGRSAPVSQTFVCDTRRSATPASRRPLQVQRLRARRCNDLASGVRGDRPGLDSCLRALRKGDVLAVWKLDRLRRPGHAGRHHDRGRPRAEADPRTRRGRAQRPRGLADGRAAAGSSR